MMTTSDRLYATIAPISAFNLLFQKVYPNNPVQQLPLRVNFVFLQPVVNASRSQSVILSLFIH